MNTVTVVRTITYSGPRNRIELQLAASLPDGPSPYNDLFSIATDTIVGEIDRGVIGSRYNAEQD